MSTPRLLGLLLQIAAAAAAAIVLTLAGPDAEAAGGKGSACGHDATPGADHPAIAGSGNPCIDHPPRTPKRPMPRVDVDDSPLPAVAVAQGRHATRGFGPLRGDVRYRLSVDDPPADCRNP